eukprot:TRINITY_DN6776_c0_g1_i1.p1 TRINITY_DN6776_c0_g1~~TRINITY_DN6776_c0_g1_i1.p1  ORF type:complete len:372 (+),score=63.20 TRINITY_DN6776_c0_g1_i1:123-1238(+)
MQAPPNLGPGSHQPPPISPDQINLVQGLIEKCIQNYMSRTETIQTLQMQAQLDPRLIDSVWRRLESENPDFFDYYRIRLKIKEQIRVFNTLVQMQAQAVKNTPPPPVSVRPAEVGDLSGFPELSKMLETNAPAKPVMIKQQSGPYGEMSPMPSSGGHPGALHHSNMNPNMQQHYMSQTGQAPMPGQYSMHAGPNGPPPPHQQQPGPPPHQQQHYATPPMSHQGSYQQHTAQQQQQHQHHEMMPPSRQPPAELQYHQQSHSSHGYPPLPPQQQHQQTPPHLQHHQQPMSQQQQHHLHMMQQQKQQHPQQQNQSHMQQHPQQGPPQQQQQQYPMPPNYRGPMPPHQQMPPHHQQQQQPHPQQRNHPSSMMHSM